MTNFTDVERLGEQRPRVSWIPPHATSTGADAMELVALAGLHLDPWEEWVLVNSLNEREDGKWAAFEVGLEVPRQNGKGSILEARELTGLFMLDEMLLVHSAHEQRTATEHFLRLLTLIESVPDFDQRVMKAPKGKGAEAIELRGGQRIFFKTRTGAGGRGLTGDFVALDEAMVLPGATVGALLPTMSARSIHGNPQLWYTGSAVDREVHEHGIVFARVRDRGRRGGDPSLMWAEWSADYETPEDVPARAADDPEVWAQTNPGLGIRISSEHVAKERRSLDHRTFCVERLGVGDWPPIGDDTGDGIDFEVWAELEDLDSTAEDPIPLTFDVRPDRSSASIGVAGRRTDGDIHVEVIEKRPGTGWVAGRLVELAERHDVLAIVCDAKSGAAALIPRINRALREADLGIEVTTTTAEEYGQACGRFFDAVDNREVHHLGTPELDSAIRGAVKRPLGDAWAWSRKSSAVDISPLVAVTLALWKVETAAPRHSGRVMSV